MSDVVNNADGQQSDSATLSFPGGTAEFPIRPAIDGASSIDLSTLTRKTGLTGLDYGFVNTASTQSKITYIDGEQGILRYRGYPIEQLAEHSTYLEVAWLLIYGELPTHRPARRVRREDPSPHAAPRGPQAVLLGAAAHRAPDGGALERRLRALDVLRGQLRPARPRPRRAHDGAPAREAAGDRGLRAQEEHRPGLPLPRQLAELRRQLPAPELRQHGRAVRDRPGALEGARPPAHPPRGPRAERVDLDRAPRRLHGREPVRVDLRRHPGPLGPAARRSERGRAADARRASATRARASRSSSSA